MNSNAVHNLLNNQMNENDLYKITYDFMGNIKTKYNKLTKTISNYTFNVRNQLTKYTKQDENNQIIKTLTYSYDAYNRRITKVEDGLIQKYLYDGDNIIAILDNQNQIIATILHDESIDTPLSITNSNGTFYYHRDHQGSIISLTDSTGQVIENFVYDNHYGRITNHTKTVETNNPYAYTGRIIDTDELYYYRARYYDPMLHRFLSEDPIGFRSGDFNWYQYAASNPVNFVDPSGLKWSSHDYMTHYKRKNPTDVSLKQTGLYNDFITSDQIVNEIQRVFNVYENQLKNKLKQKCKNACGTVSATIDVHKEDSPYSFQWALGQTIVVMGDGTMFNKGKCAGKMNCATKGISGNCNLHFYVRDWFKDPYDWFSIIPGEQGGGTPYRLNMDTIISRSF